MCWFRSDLTQKNIGILRTERPDTEFVHTMNKIRIVINLLKLKNHNVKYDHPDNGQNSKTLSLSIASS